VSTSILILEAGENLDLRTHQAVDIIVRGDVIVKDRYGTALRLLNEASLAKTLGTIIEASKPAEPRHYGRIGK
jgi:hypothetical protein